MFTYCGNSPVANYDPAGNYYANAEERITTGCGGRGGVPVPYSKTDTSDSTPKTNRNIQEWINFITNTDEQAVLDAEFAAFYKGRLVIKVPEQSAGFSCGIMFIGSNVASVETVKHEYGHTKQLETLGFSTYLDTVLVPSVTFFALKQIGVFPAKYYFSLPWERKADELGQTTDDYLPGSEFVSDVYWNLSKATAIARGFI